MEGERRERKREVDGGDGQQMGTPLLLSADHSSSERDSQAQTRARDGQSEEATLEITFSVVFLFF